MASTRIEDIEARLTVVRLWERNKITLGDALRRLVAAGMTRDEARAYLSC